jgi:hypothetical protein
METERNLLQTRNAKFTTVITNSIIKDPIRSLAILTQSQCVSRRVIVVLQQMDKEIYAAKKDFVSVVPTAIILRSVCQLAAQFPLMAIIPVESIIIF